MLFRSSTQVKQTHYFACNIFTGFNYSSSRRANQRMAENKDDRFDFLCSISLLLNVERVVIFMSQLWWPCRLLCHLVIAAPVESVE